MQSHPACMRSLCRPCPWLGGGGMFSTDGLITPVTRSPRLTPGQRCRHTDYNCTKSFEEFLHFSALAHRVQVVRFEVSGGAAVRETAIDTSAVPYDTVDYFCVRVVSADGGETRLLLGGR